MHCGTNTVGHRPLRKRLVVCAAWVLALQPLAWPADARAQMGGGFGGKEDYPSVIAGHAVLLALKARRPVKIVYDRVEDLQATTKRHPCQTRMRTALDADGRVAIDGAVIYSRHRTGRFPEAAQIIEQIRRHG